MRVAGVMKKALGLRTTRSPSSLRYMTTPRSSKSRSASCISGAMPRSVHLSFTSAKETVGPSRPCSQSRSAIHTTGTCACTYLSSSNSESSVFISSCSSRSFCPSLFLLLIGMKYSAVTPSCVVPFLNTHGWKRVPKRAWMRSLIFLCSTRSETVSECVPTKKIGAVGERLRMMEHHLDRKRRCSSCVARSTSERSHSMLKVTRNALVPSSTR
mmetsp:Transcript_37380/g.87965  ORF Transcript_37380/g.87965 Transcript_37380/m.87965 type:complete len:213 (-) Transcript_37380:536-1174(-)